MNNVIEDIQNYLVLTLSTVFLIWSDGGMLLWGGAMFLGGDQSTLLAVDAVVGLVTGQDFTTFAFRANVAVWWTKVAI